jgi:hypothetical protein
MVLDGITYFTEKELAGRYDLSLRWLQRTRLTSKDMPYYKLHGRVYYNEKEIDKWFKDNLKAM